MSEYPYYGATYGSRDQTNPQSYLPPTYPNSTPFYQQNDGRPVQPSMNQAYDNTMAAYGYNQHIPYSAPTVQTNLPPMPSFQGWNQDNPALSHYSAHPQSMQSYGAYNQQNYNQNSQYYAPVGVPSAQPTYQSQAPAYGNAGDREMSEGEYDDGSAHITHPPATALVGASGSNNYHGNDGNGFLDTAHRAVYSQSQNNSPQQPPALRSGKSMCRSLKSPLTHPPSVWLL